MKKHISTFGIGIAFPVLLFLASPYWSNFFSDTKKLEYKVVRSTSISQIDSEDPLKNELKIEYKGKEIANGTSTIIAISNTGEVPIKREDFDTPINIDFKGGTLIAGRVISTNPPDLNVDISHSGNRAIIQPLLLNPNDLIVLNLLSDNDTELDRVTSRIAGIASVDKISERMNEGFAIKYIQPGDREGSTIELQVMKISKSVATILSMVLLIASCYLFFTVFKQDSLLKKILQALLALTLELLAATILQIPATYLAENLNLASWVIFSLKLLTLAASMIFALKLRRILENKSIEASVNNLSKAGRL